MIRLQPKAEKQSLCNVISGLLDHETSQVYCSLILTTNQTLLLKTGRKFVQTVKRNDGPRCVQNTAIETCISIVALGIKL